MESAITGCSPPCAVCFQSSLKKSAGRLSFGASAPGAAECASGIVAVNAATANRTLRQLFLSSPLTAAWLSSGRACRALGVHGNGSVQAAAFVSATRRLLAHRLSARTKPGVRRLREQEVERVQIERRVHDGGDRENRMP